MTLIQPRMSDKPSTADRVIERMVKLLSIRREAKISRVVFLRRWGRLRIALQFTKEYQAFRAAVIARDGGKCKVCGKETTLVHHLKLVSREPRLATVVSNGELRCTDCHVDEHPWMRRSA